MDTEQRTRKESSPTYSEADVGHPELFGLLRQWRAKKAEAQGVPHFQILHQKTLVQIAVHLPDTLAGLNKIKGIGKRLAEKYGTELVALVADYRRQHHIKEVTLPDSTINEPAANDKKKSVKKEDSKRFSLELFNKGLSMLEIADERGLTVQTIEGHLAFFVKKGELAITGLVAEDKHWTIEQKAAALPGSSLRELRTALGDDYSYGEINLVLAHLQYLEKH
jgi:uncharacterized protein YpbB